MRWNSTKKVALVVRCDAVTWEIANWNGHACLELGYNIVGQSQISHKITTKFKQNWRIYWKKETWRRKYEKKNLIERILKV